MALTEKQKDLLRVALGAKKTSDNEADAIIAEIESGANLVAANVAEIGDTSTATAEDVGDKVNEVIAALVAAGLMESP